MKIAIIQDFAATLVGQEAYHNTSDIVQTASYGCCLQQFLAASSVSSAGLTIATAS